MTLSWGSLTKYKIEQKTDSKGFSDTNMSPKKLTEEDKQNILELYRNSEATTSTLATDFGVSSSTISRFLKNSLAKSEYDDLIQQKRLARTAKGEERSQAKKITPTPKQKEVTIDSKVSVQEQSSPNQLIIGHKTLKLDEKEEPSTMTIGSKPSPSLLSKTSVTPKPSIAHEALNEEEEEDDDDVDVVLREMLGEDIEDIDDIEDEEDLDGWDSETDDVDNYPHTSPSKADLQIRPLTEAALPRVCYLVIDRAAELIVKPLQEFADLGSIPQEEITQKTLPVFDNHRVAKRFSHRREKVIKVPDSEMLKKTSHHLYSKGITRLLVEGQIYSITL